MDKYGLLYYEIVCQQIPRENQNCPSLKISLFPYPVWAAQAWAHLWSSTEVTTYKPNEYPSSPSPVAPIKNAEMWKVLSRASVQFVNSALLKKHGCAEWRTHGGGQPSSYVDIKGSF